MWEVYSDTLGTIGYVTARNRTQAIRAARKQWPDLGAFNVEAIEG